MYLLHIVTFNFPNNVYPSQGGVGIKKRHLHLLTFTYIHSIPFNTCHMEGNSGLLFGQVVLDNFTVFSKYFLSPRNEFTAVCKKVGTYRENVRNVSTTEP